MTNAEEVVAKWLKRQGFYVITRGWPDFMCVAAGWRADGKHRVCCVEVKNGKDSLSKEQKIIHALLKRSGIPVYVLRPESLKRKPSCRLIDTSDNLRELNLRLGDLEHRVNSIRETISACEVMFDLSDEELTPMLESTVKKEEMGDRDAP